ncbi:MAG: T9SS type A sorting domain-containing protein [Candidatus Marinimicrobia bacterium]|nr:T9SS type A sorting domain-containing protein [Candidatus Neomarinimicrobiota bacterium]
MISISKKISLFFFFLLPIAMVASQSISFTFEQNQLKFRKFNNYDIVRLANYDLMQQPGHPALPFYLYQFRIPSNRQLTEIEINTINKDTLPGNFNILPGSKQYILSQKPAAVKLARSSIYNSSKPYPAQIIKKRAVGYLAGEKIATLQIFPLIYYPKQKKVVLITDLDITIRDTLSSGRMEKASRSQKSNLSFTKNFPEIHFGEFNALKSHHIIDTTNHPYVIITSNTLHNSFKKLSEWKTQKGLNAKIINTEYIETNYNGEDLQAKIRDFIIFAKNNWNTQWVLLGGDTEIIPARYTWAFDCEANSVAGENDIPCDLYFSDLDGNWDRDGDGIYGEVADSIDMYPDIFVGRLPVENQNEANAIIKKIIEYEKSPNQDNILNMLFLAMVLWQEPYTDAAIGKDFIDSVFVPERFDPINKLYESRGKGKVSNVISQINSGINIINHNGHAWYSSMGVGSHEYLLIEDMDSLQNNVYPLLYSIGCWPAAFDHDCIAEHFLTNPDGGGVAFIGNSRYGWGSPGNPLFGYSDRFDRIFFDNLLDNNIVRLGAALAATKTRYIPLSQQENVYRWCQYELNLLGDPEMPVWTDLPSDFSIHHPEELSVGQNSIKITVEGRNGMIEDALVCLMQNNGIYKSGYTTSSGQIRFDANINNMDTVLLTITKPNFQPFQEKIPISMDQNYIYIDSLVNKAFYRKENLNQPVNIDFYLNNPGNRDISLIKGKITSPTVGLTMLDSTYRIANFTADESRLVEDSIALQLDRKFNDGESIILNHYWQISQFEKGSEKLTIRAKAAQPKYTDYYISELEKDYYNKLNLITKNTGSREYNGTVIINNYPNNLNIKDTINPISGLRAGDSDTTSFLFNLAQDVKLPYFPSLTVNYSMPWNNFQKDTIKLELGNFGFSDNMEAGTNKWLIEGPKNIWHLSEEKSASGKYSWHPGYADKFGYPSSLDSNYLKSQTIVVDQSPILKFKAWYRFPNYGTDGLYVQIKVDSNWRTLDFIGSGGALATLPTWNDWYEYSYDLSGHLDPGDKTSIRFKMQSDNSDSTDGIFIDDVRISGHQLKQIFSEPEKPDKFILYSNFPNPFNSYTNFRFYLPQISDVKIKIYDIQGRLVDSINKKGLKWGEHVINWQVGNLSSGVYIYNVSTQKKQKTDKLLILK